MYFIISMAFLLKNLSRKIFCLKSTEYGYSRYYLKNVPLSYVITFIVKYQYRYRHYF